MWTPELIEEQKKYDAERAAAAAARKKPEGLPDRGRVTAWGEQYKRDQARVTGVATTGASGAGFADGWGKGANPIVDAMNKASEAGAAGSKMGGQFSSSLSGSIDAGLKTVDAAIAAAIQRWIGMVNSVNINGPTITPRINNPAGAPAGSPAAAPAGPKLGMIDLMDRKHSMYSDATNFGPSYG